MFSRRDFIAAGLTSAAAGLVVPPALAKGVLAAANDGVHNDHVLVVLQLGGGNDGLNTVVPYADGAYHDARPTIGVPPDKVLHLDAHVGLHPALTGFKALYDAGQVAVVQGVGYDTPTYSHFEGAHVWEYADPRRQAVDGWLGRLLSTQSLDAAGHPMACCAVGQASEPAELRTQSGAVEVSVIDSVAGYTVQGGDGRSIAVTNLYQRTPGLYGVLFDQAVATAARGIGALEASATYTPGASYEPKGVVYGSKVDLASSLQLAARIIVTQPGTKIIHAVLGGWDTHQQQGTRQQSLLANIDSAVSAFMQDLKAHGVDRRVTLFTWSEFGRRVKENGAGGTDHGAAAPMFVLGGAVQGGLLGQQPSLTNTIDSGNLKYAVDFRSVYQSLIRDWLGGDAASVLGGSFAESGLRWS